jgi:integrase
MQNRWTSWIKPQMGNKRISDLCDSDLQHVLDTAFKKKHLAKKTLKNIRGDMSAFIKYCRREKLTTYIPDDITIPAAALDSTKTILQPDSLVKLFSSDMTVDHHKPVFEPYINAFRFQVLTGLRPGELLGLMQSDIRDGIMYIQRSVDITGIITPGKNKNARRSQVLTEAEKQVLADQLALEESMFIFRIESQQDYRNHLKRYCKANGIPKVTPYELRHTFVSIAKSLPEGVVKPLVGHSVSMDTFGVYGHFLDGDGNKTASLLSDVFKQLLTVKSDAG